MRRYFLLLFVSPIFRKLSIVQTISYFGTWFSQVAIFSMLVAMGASEMQIAFAATANMLPAIILAPFIGIIVDRIDFKRLALGMLGIEIVATLGFIAIDSLEWLWVLLVLIFVRSSAASLLFTAEMSLLPKILKGQRLKRANEIHAMIWSLTYAVGMATGGLLTHQVGFDGAFLIDALLYLIAVAILFTLHLPSKTHTPSKQSPLKMFFEGWHYLRTHPLLFSLIILHASVGLTSFDTLVTLLADHRYAELIAVPIAIGAMNGVRALGLLIGPILLSKHLNHRTLTYLFFFQGATIILWALTQGHWYFSLVALLLVGLSTTSLWSYTYMLIQTHTRSDMLGRIISYNDMIFMISNALTALFIGLLASAGVGLGQITWMLGVGFWLFGFYYKRKILPKITTP